MSDERPEITVDTLRERGFLHPERSLHNLEALTRAFGFPQLHAWLELSLEAEDPDLALNGLEHALVSLPPEEIDLARRPRCLARLVRLAGVSEQLARFAVEHLEWLDRLTLTRDRAEDVRPRPPEDLLDSAQLARWHRRELVRVCLAEIYGAFDVAETARALSAIADMTLATVLAREGEGGPPIAVVAMGKWGGLELNYSSDIDLFFLRADDSDPVAADRLARRILKGLRGTPGWDHLYRTDLRLRPGGEQAPLVPSVTQAGHELKAQGGTWERLIHLRVRIAAGDPEIARPYLAAVEEFTYARPFRLQEIRHVKNYKNLLEISDAGRDRERREVKVGWGGIRDVEYVVQFLQLLHGSIYPEIRGGNVFAALERLGTIGALSTTESSFLASSYRFLRLVEHRLMLRHRRPNFLLPEDEDAQRALARAFQHRDWESFRREFDRRRAGIREVLDRLFHRLFVTESEEDVPEINLALAFKPSRDEIERVFKPLGLRDPLKAYTLFRRLAYPQRKVLQSPRARQLLAHIFPRFLRRLAQTPDPDQAALLFTNCVETLGTPTTFYQLLADSPDNVRLFVDLFGRSRFVSDLLLDHPGILDEVFDLLRVGERLTIDGLTDELRDALQHSDPTARARVMHEFRAVHTLEIAILDVSARVPHLGIVRRLSALARAIVKCVDDFCHLDTRGRLGALVGQSKSSGSSSSESNSTESAPARHCILGLGRLGGDEMGYASDIDMLLLYDGEARTEEGVTEREFYTQHLQAVIAALTDPRSGGTLYPVDLRLRPRGAGGALVHSFREFRSYFSGEESQVWEHQALVRASFVAGDEELGKEVMAFIHQTLGRGLPRAVLLQELESMHARRKEGATGDGFYVKSGPGALLDLEFLVQSAALLSPRGEPYPANTYATIHELAKRGLLAARVAAELSTAYNFFRLVENRLSMLHRSSVRVVPTDHDSLRELALRIGYTTDDDSIPEEMLHQEIRYHTERVVQILEAQLESYRVP